MFISGLDIVPPFLDEAIKLFLSFTHKIKFILKLITLNHIQFLFGILNLPIPKRKHYLKVLGIFGETSTHHMVYIIQTIAIFYGCCFRDEVYPTTTKILHSVRYENSAGPALCMRPSTKI